MQSNILRKWVTTLTVSIEYWCLGCKWRRDQWISTVVLVNCLCCDTYVVYYDTWHYLWCANHYVLLLLSNREAPTAMLTNIDEIDRNPQCLNMRHKRVSQSISIWPMIYLRICHNYIILGCVLYSMPYNYEQLECGKYMLLFYQFKHEYFHYIFLRFYWYFINHQCITREQLLVALIWSISKPYEMCVLWTILLRIPLRFAVTVLCKVVSCRLNPLYHGNKNILQSGTSGAER